MNNIDKIIDCIQKLNYVERSRDNVEKDHREESAADEKVLSFDDKKSERKEDAITDCSKKNY